MTIEVALLLAALAFAIVNGVNDGGALLAVGLSVRAIPPAVALVLVSVSVVVIPLVVGTSVATTLATRMVVLDGPEGGIATLAAVLVAVVVAFGLAARGLPTSLTLALIGAIAGAGLGAGLPVAWPTVAIVLTAAAIAPLVGLMVARGLVGVAGMSRSRLELARRVRRWHIAGFALLCVAYGANDGQKMLAVLAIASGAVATQVDPSLGQLSTVGGLFLLGALIGLPRIAGTVTTGVVPLQPPEAALTEVAAGTVVLGTGALGAPVSMTQAVAGSIVGASITRGRGRVRWREVARLASAWAITLPLASALAAAIAAIAVRTP